MGWIAPISLLTAIIDTKMVSGRRSSARAFTSTIPRAVTGAYDTSNPCELSHLALSVTAGCSIAETIICFPKAAFSKAIPLIAQLSLSVPPDVKRFLLF